MDEGLAGPRPVRLGSVASGTGVPMKLATSLAAALLLVLGACSGEPEVLEPDPSASSAEQPSVPEQPDVAGEESDSGAATFVRYWLDTSDYAALSGDTKTLRRLSDPACGGCFEYIDLYERTYEAGGYFRGGEQAMEDVSVRDEGSGRRLVFAEVSLSDGAFKKDEKSTEVDTQASSNRVAFTVEYRNDQWLMTEQAVED